MDRQTQENNILEMTPEFTQAVQLMEFSNVSLFITGKAGTGKSTLLTYFTHTTHKRMVILAPTGVAALNVHGQTIHSFFGFKPGITPEGVRELKPGNKKKIVKNLDMIIIDEISMVRADLLDCVDIFLRLYGPKPGTPFGGIQMVFIGDLYQLPPVVTRDEEEVLLGIYDSPNFFSAKAMSQLPIWKIELDKVFRQSDNEFITILNHIRDNSVTSQDLDIINTRYVDNFEFPDDDYYICLTTTNRVATDINQRHLDKLNSTLETFEGELEGKFPKDYLPTSADLILKEGAQIMMTANDPSHRWVNGTLGKLLKINHKGDGTTLLCELQNGTICEVNTYKWEIIHYELYGDIVVPETLGSFTQFPVMLAWAVTIHKSQGKTFDKVMIDMGTGAFAHGQTYVALSRCRSLDGIVLRRRITRRDIMTDPTIKTFLRKIASADEILPPDQAKLPTLKDTNNVRPLARYSFDE
jgi:ATP-dependent exoDNAse (exonuclease V) alpha subunit